MALTAGLPMVTDALPTNYEYYTSGGIKSGLSADQPYFTLNDRNVSIYSGAMHYFRVPRPYWRDRLRKMRAAGLNAVETYIPWNLHEYQNGKYDFGDGGSDMEDFLHLEEFLKTAQEEDLFAIIRSGPFICAEFEFGGFPSWLLREDGIAPRTSDAKFMSFVTRFFNVLMPILALLQFTKGGPIISFQVENEYAMMWPRSDEYLTGLRQILLDNGIVELMTTADNPDKGTDGTIPDLFLLTGNFNTEPKNQLDMLKALQPEKPLMTMEYWSGWFDFWGQEHNENPLATFSENYEAILSYPSSVNIYMFHGGTNFGFLNGAQNLNYDDENSGYASITSSYDYSAPLSEWGDYTDKYYAVKELLEKYNPVKTKLPDAPASTPTTWYEKIEVTQQILIEDLLSTMQPVQSESLVSMEKLDVNDGSGQSYGYIVYRQENIDIAANAVLTIEGRVCDTLMVLVNGVLVSPALQNSEDLDQYGTWRTANSALTLSTTDLEGATLDLIVENWSRVNVGVYKQFKGIYQGVATIDGVELKNWSIFPLDFQKSWTNGLDIWKDVNLDTYGPSMYKATLEIADDPQDTFVFMEEWTKGIVVINGFVLGRYAHMGPIQTLYLPAPLLKKGTNDIVIFEHFWPAYEVEFAEEHYFAQH
ncbi:hypothetical protein NQ317_015090 [Molorchus minor]|uniref:Beta-galactosidase n=1 Tax=Molorchus minor TaxID=1323400 RepID=A0ABQ9K7K3_9CUCU|nr:hypothetical protein NQ317_015090 [Molorchus minor]